MHTIETGRQKVSEGERRGRQYEQVVIGFDKERRRDAMDQCDLPVLDLEAIKQLGQQSEAICEMGTRV